MADVTFKDNRIAVRQGINDAVIIFLTESASEITSQTQRNTRVDTGQLKGSWNYQVDEANSEAVIGSPLENAVWEEFGTGEYAAEGNGRKGGWLIPAEKLTANAQQKLAANKRIIDGKEFYLTYGKKPNHTLQRAIDTCKSRIMNRAETIFNEEMGGLDA